MGVSGCGCPQLQLGGEEVRKSWTITIFHHLPHAPSTGAVLHLWSLVTHSQNFTYLPSPANAGSTKHAGALLESTGNRLGVMRRPEQPK